jgi:hypothetical protein
MAQRIQGTTGSSLFEKIRGLWGARNAKPLPRQISNREQLARMQCNVRGSLLTLLRKEAQGDLLSRAEWQFLSFMSNQTYDSAHHQLDVIDRNLIAANMSAFAAVMKLRDEQYPHLANQNKDQYYWGNIGFSWADRAASGKDLQAYIRAGVEGLPDFPSSGCGTFSSRNLDVSLRDEPELDHVRLNTALKPFLRSLLLVCVYGYWKENNESIITDRDRSDGRKKTAEELAMKNLVTLESVSNEHYHLSVHATETTISIGITARHHPYTLALNNYVELTSFASMLMRLSPQTHHTTAPGFELMAMVPYSATKSQHYMLESGRWRHPFSSEELEALKDLFEKFFTTPSTSAHLKQLEAIYGKI